MKEGIAFDKGINSRPADPMIQVYDMVCQDLSVILGIPSQGSKDLVELVGGRYYLVSRETYSKSMADKLGIVSVNDFYGSALDIKEQAGKSILHPCLDTENPPPFYSESFASSVKDLVLPGISAFSNQHLMFAIRKMGYDFSYLRTKVSGGSGGLGQVKVNLSNDTPEVLLDLAYVFGTSDQLGVLRRDGIVVEPDLQGAKTISVGFSKLDGQTYSFLARQKDLEYPGFNRFLGADLLMVKGGFRKLGNIEGLSEIEQIAIGTASKFNRQYFKHFDPLASRLSFDFLYGTDQLGNVRYGITDITARVGGYCPAVLMAVQKFIEHPRAKFVNSEFNINITPEIPKPYEQGAKVYLVNEYCRGSARVNGVYS